VRVLPGDRLRARTVLKSFSSSSGFSVLIGMWNVSFSSSLRVPRSRGSGLGQRSPAKVAAAENAISQAPFWSVQTRSGKVVGAAGFAKSLGLWPGGLRRNRTGSAFHRVFPARPNCLQRYANFSRVGLTLPQGTHEVTLGLCSLTWANLRSQPIIGQQQ
jgi:hypothetical protein